jgi:hypothetical protein
MFSWSGSLSCRHFLLALSPIQISFLRYHVTPRRKLRTSIYGDVILLEVQSGVPGLGRRDAGSEVSCPLVLTSLTTFNFISVLSRRFSVWSSFVLSRMINSLNHSGNCTYHLLLHLQTLHYPTSVFIGFIWFSVWTAIISLNSVNQLIVVMEKLSGFF